MKRAAEQEPFTLAIETPGKHLHDLSPMPFGKHKETPMQDVPAAYLHYLWHSGLRNERRSPVREYIERTRHALQREHPDLIWD